MINDCINYVYYHMYLFGGFRYVKAMLPKGGDAKNGKIALDATLRNVRPPPRPSVGGSYRHGFMFRRDFLQYGLLYLLSSNFLHSFDFHALFGILSNIWGKIPGEK